jgi:hypothetical protein
VMRFLSPFRGESVLDNSKKPRQRSMPIAMCLDKGCVDAAWRELASSTA